MAHITHQWRKVNWKSWQHHVNVPCSRTMSLSAWRPTRPSSWTHGVAQHRAKSNVHRRESITIASGGSVRQHVITSRQLTAISCRAHVSVAVIVPPVRYDRARIAFQLASVVIVFAMASVDRSIWHMTGRTLRSMATVRICWRAMSCSRMCTLLRSTRQLAHAIPTQRRSQRARKHSISHMAVTLFTCKSLRAHHRSMS